MCYLTTVVGSFHGRVLAARLGAEGVVVVLKGAADGPYPLQSAVDVLVPADQLSLAREILLGDAVDNAFEGVMFEDAGSELPDVEEASSWRSSDAGTTVDAADTFSLHDDADPRRGRCLRGLPAVLVVVVVAMMIVVGCVAALAH